jgi:hypothetical protein
MEDDDLNVTKSRLLWAGALVRGYELLPPCGLEKRVYEPRFHTAISFSNHLQAHAIFDTYDILELTTSKITKICAAVVPVCIQVPPGLKFTYSHT